MAINFWKKNQKKPEADVKGDAKGDVKEKEVKTPAKGTPKAEASTTNTRQAPQVLLRPVLTEKSTRAGVYYFQIPLDVNRSEVKKAIQSVYGVTPIKVNIMNRKGKAMVFGGRQGARSDWKRAIVMLKKGESISVE